MFGFGRPANEKAVIALFTTPLLQIGLLSGEATTTATQFVDETLRELKTNGEHPFQLARGDLYATRPEFMEPRFAEGLRVADVLSHWNRPVLIVFTEARMIGFLSAVSVDLKIAGGVTREQAWAEQRKFAVRYGNPNTWDREAPENAGLEDGDAPLYIEFSNRVAAWQRKSSSAEIRLLSFTHRTFNGAFREAVAQGLA